MKILLVGLDAYHRPGAITAAVDAVEAEWGQVDKVISLSTKLVTTVDRRGREVAGAAITLLQNEFRVYYKERIEFSPMYIDFKSLESAEAVQEFWALAFQQIDHPRREGHEVYVALAEGDRRIDAILGNAAMIAAATTVFVLNGTPPDIGRVRGMPVRNGEADWGIYSSTVEEIKMHPSGDPKREKILHPGFSPIVLPLVDLSFLVDTFALPKEQRKPEILNLLLSAKGAIKMPQGW